MRIFSTIKPYLKFRFFLFFFAFIAGWPCVFYLMGWLPHYTTNYVALFIVAGFYALSKRGISLPKPIRDIFTIQIFCWIFYGLCYQDTSYFTRIVLLSTTYLLLAIQMRYRDKFELQKTYCFWVTFQVVAGTIGFLLVLLGVLHPFFEFAEMDGRPGYFFGLFTTNTYLGGLIRNAGFYDEPGALAFWGMNALLMNKLFIGNKRIEQLLLLGLISTLSVAYFIQVAFYLYFFFGKRRKRMLVLLVTGVIMLKVLGSVDEAFIDASFGRLEYNEEKGTIEGDNRSALMERCWKIFLTSPVFGVGAENLATNVSKQEGFVGGNFFFNWAADGLVGVLCVYLPLIYLYRLGRGDKRIRGVVLILILGFLQRPYTDTQLLYPLVLFSILLGCYIRTYKGYTLSSHSETAA